MKKLALTLPMIIFMLVACDSNQETQTTPVKKSDIDKTVTPVVPASDVVKEKISPEAEIKKIATEVKALEPEPEVKVSMSGEQVYKKSCQSCHASGAAGAPKLGDAAAWKPRVDKGTDVLYLSALKGIPGTAMMAKGTCGACSEEELHAAVDYMVSKVKK